MADDKDVVRFLSLFHRLKDSIDDPTDILEMAPDDEPFRNLCIDLANIALSLSLAERKHRELFTAPVNPNFVAAWRDYEDRYETVLSGIMLADLVGMDVCKLDYPGTTPEFMRRWVFAAEEAREEAHAIEEVFSIAEDISAQWSDSDLRDAAERGTAEWRRLTDEVGFDLSGTFRRRKLIPFVLVPRHVSKSHGPKERLSLLTHLRQAHEAFVYGVPFAALALLRSLLELVLKTHYAATESDLDAQINRAKLPASVSKNQLHRLRILANDVLHANRDSTLIPSSNEELEREILSFLLQLRALIERAPAPRLR
jgi:hypothetical protein